MGKKYKNKKLVKTLLRSLPPKSETKKTAMGTTLDTDTIDVDDVVGHLQAYEMHISAAKGNTSLGIAFVSEEQQDIRELKEAIGLMAKNFSRALRRVE